MFVYYQVSFFFNEPFYYFVFGDPSDRFFYSVYNPYFFPVLMYTITLICPL